MTVRGQKRGSNYILIYASLREELEEFEFSQRSKAEEGMVERQDLLDRNLAPTGLVKSSCDSAIGAFANGMQ